jgi:hypothetical protein
MLARERARASKALKKRLAQYGRNLADVMKRKFEGFKPLSLLKPVQESKKPLGYERLRSWHSLMRELIDAGVDMKEAQRLVNAKMKFPSDWSPGQGAPVEL